MKLSDGEKLILVMLSEIYKHNKIEGNIDPELVLTSVFDDQTWGLKWQYGSLFNDQGEDSPVVQETCDILNMYRAITAAWGKLSEADKKRVQAGAAPYNSYVEFQGFDGNNDPHISVARYLVKSLKRYDEVKLADLNSHSSMTLPHYRNMLAVFGTIEDPYRCGLSPEQIISIIKGGS